MILKIVFANDLVLIFESSGARVVPNAADICTLEKAKKMSIVLRKISRPSEKSMNLYGGASGVWHFKIIQTATLAQ